jgi:hypothetical protein
MDCPSWWATEIHSFGEVILGSPYWMRGGRPPGHKSFGWLGQAIRISGLKGEGGPG